MAKPCQFSVFSSQGIGLSLTHQPSSHGFLPSSRSLQLLSLHSHAITPAISIWGRRHEFPLPLKQAQIQARRVLRLLLLWAQSNSPLNSDPACIAFRSLSTSRFLGSAQRLGAGGLRLAPIVSPRSPVSRCLLGERGV